MSALVCVIAFVFNVYLFWCFVSAFVNLIQSRTSEAWTKREPFGNDQALIIPLSFSYNADRCMCDYWLR